MSEINHRYLKDNDGNRYFPVTHVDAIRGLESLIKDSGWVEFTPVNGKPNQAFKDNDDKGYNCSYRTIEFLDVKIKTVRLNLSDISYGMTIYNFPDDFAKESQSWLVRTPANRLPVTISLRPSGKLSLSMNYIDRDDWVENNYIYGSFTWIE
ncbi:MAG: hypothetical protein L0L10_08525 [Tetragenococcus sp.]|nr:hypothetical protein [Tetragenococcus sp.]